MPADTTGRTFGSVASLHTESVRSWRTVTLLLLGLLAGGCRAPQAQPLLDGPAGVTTESVTIERVVDGDTVVLVDGRTVRVSGIDTPETKHPRTGVECYGPEATRYAEETLTGAPVRLEPDGGSDRYGRTLGHLWYRSAGGWVNYGLAALAGGHADLYRDADHRHRAEFEDAQRDARDAGRGLWGTCG